MNRAFVLLTLIFALALPLLAQQGPAPGESVADYARKVREQKKGEKKVASNRVYTNDNLPKADSLSTSSSGGGESAEATPASGDAAAAKGEKPLTEEEQRAKAQEEKAKLEKEWREKFATQKKRVADLQHEIENITREMNMMGTIAAMGDMGCLQVPQKCADARDAYLKQIDDKKKELATETQKLDDMREDLRRAGLPSSWGE